MNISIAIPTKNRPELLLEAVRSIIRQDRRPNQLIIIDQSECETGKVLVQQELDQFKDIELIYVLDSSINGLVEAKNESLKYATGDIIGFLDDDIILENDYFLVIERSFTSKPDVIGICGIPTNYPVRGFWRRFFFSVFHRGIFKDIRGRVYDGNMGKDGELVPSAMLSGGAMWRSDVFSLVQFDLHNDLHVTEDIDFSNRVVDRFGLNLYVNPLAKLVHHRSPMNRASLGPSQHRKLTEFFTFFKKRQRSPIVLMCFVWLLVGFLFEAFFQSYSNKTLTPLLGFFTGVRRGYQKNLA